MVLSLFYQFKIYRVHIVVEILFVNIFYLNYTFNHYLSQWLSIYFSTEPYWALLANSHQGSQWVIMCCMTRVLTIKGESRGPPSLEIFSFFPCLSFSFAFAIQRVQITHGHDVAIIQLCQIQSSANEVKPRALGTGMMHGVVCLDWIHQIKARFSTCLYQFIVVEAIGFVLLSVYLRKYCYCFHFIKPSFTKLNV